MTKYIRFAIAACLFALSTLCAAAAELPADSLQKPGGAYIWVPDSMIAPVGDVISGKADAVRKQRPFNPDEKVIVRGDTLNLYVRQRNLGRFDRGLYNYLFVPKGTWKFGVTAAYGEFSTSDLTLMDLLDDFDFSGHTFSIRPYISYFIRNNLSVGLRLGYTNATGKLGSLKMDFDDDLNIDIHDVDYRNESYTAAIMCRQYIGLSRRGRFGVYNEVELAFSSGNSRFQRPFGGRLKDTKTTSMDARLTFSPGLSVMMTKNVSFNVSFGVFGFYINNERQTVDGVKAGDRFTSGANFRFNIFNINFGLGVQI